MEDHALHESLRKSRCFDCQQEQTSPKPDTLSVSTRPIRIYSLHTALLVGDAGVWEVFITEGETGEVVEEPKEWRINRTVAYQ